MNSKSSSSWLVPIGTHCQEPRLSLFCFPPAGAGALFFTRWSSLLSDDGITFWAIRLPGREMRRNEPLLTKWSELIDPLVEVLQVHCSRKPFAFFGHSLGALVSFEMAHQIQKNVGCSPKALILSSREPPHYSTNLRDYRRGDRALLEELRADGGTPEAVLHNSELMAMYLPIYRADLQLNQNYQYSSRNPLDCPLLALGGENDQTISAEALAQWQSYTNGHFQFQLFPGGHMYLTQEQGRTALVRTLVKFLK